MTNLTTRQVQILELLGESKSTRDIAARTGLSVKTIEFHLTRLYKRLGVKGREELLRRAI